MVEEEIIAYFKSRKFLNKVSISADSTFNVKIERKEASFQEIEEENIEFGDFDRNSDNGYEALANATKNMKRKIFLFKNRIESVLSFLDIPRKNTKFLALLQFEILSFLQDKVIYDNKVSYEDSGELMNMHFNIRYDEDLHGFETSDSSEDALISAGNRKWKLE